MRVDLALDQVGLHASSREGYVERGVGTEKFAAAADVLVAINTDWSDGYTPVGLAISDGDQWHDHIRDDTLGNYWGYVGCTAEKDCTLSWEYPLDRSPFFAHPSRHPYRFYQAFGTNGSQLLEDGAAWSGCYDSADNPRSAIGFEADGTTMWLVVVDGRSGSAAGMTCSEMRALMLDLGCWSAGMLDGGGSSTLVIDGEVVNNPSDGGTRNVSNHLGVIYQETRDADCPAWNGAWCEGDELHACQGGRKIRPWACDDEGLACFDLGEGAACGPLACLENPYSCECTGEDEATCDEDGDGYAASAGDCDDLAPTVHPEAGELCDGRDNDCDGLVDEDLDRDGDGWPSCGGDCDDADASRFPGALEGADGVDDDCDGRVDEGTARYDDDFDGWTEEAGDCDDAAAARFPGAPELPDAVDDDCDGTVDEGTAWFDDDGDGWTEVEGDCDDADPDRYPGAAEAVDLRDDDCDGLVDEGTAWFDDDGDGWTEVAADCDDADRLAWPGAPERENGRDDDCDGAVDEGTTLADDDGDGWTEVEGDCGDAD
ncbi:phosphodiester glycosidase family protein, partial [Myxococcota bacterium]|nr:phosphodiester glycosidase family protein [Myxococcota bacterium]